VALSVLDGARAARERLPDLDDVEALHDFRVALRRLRSVLRAFRPLFGDALSGKLRRRLRDLAAATGEARDAEVQLLWIQEARQKLPAGKRTGVAWLLARLVERRDHAYETVRRDVAPAFDKLERRLRRALGAVEAPEADVAPFGVAVGERLAAEAAELEQRLALVHTAADEGEAHRARVEIKRIRYLLEPIGPEQPQATAALKRLKKAQDTLGELHDLHTTAAHLGDAAAAAAAERARRLHQEAVDGAASPRSRGPRPATAGLLTLARLARREQDRLVGVVLADRATRTLATDLETLADELRATLPAQPASPPAATKDPAPQAHGNGRTRLPKRRRRVADGALTPTSKGRSEARALAAQPTRPLAPDAGQGELT